MRAAHSTVSAMVRHADPERDAAAIAAIYRPSVDGGVASFEAEPPDAAEMARRIAEGAKEYPWLVAERDGAVAGYAYGARHRARAAYRWTVEVTVYVDGSRRRSGVGRELYGALLPLLARQRLHLAVAGITLPNDASVALHEAVGFEPVGVYREIGHKYGRWHDVGWWQARLRASGEEPEEPLGPQQLS
jgi:phosphinothricin acetyltransferase